MNAGARAICATVASHALTVATITGRRFRNTVVSCSITASPCWLIVTWRMRAMPRSGLDVESRELGDVGDHAQRVARPHRPRELDLADAGRAQAAGAEHALVEPQPQGHRHGVQARRDQAAERPLLGELGVGVERLRIPLPGEIDDRRFGHGQAGAGESVADLEILIITNAHRTGSMQAVSDRAWLAGRDVHEAHRPLETYRVVYFGGDCVERETPSFSACLC